MAARANSSVGGVATFTALTLSNGAVASSNYTPTLTGVANVAASTAFSCHYMQVGDVVTVAGRFNLDPTAGSTLTTMGISLPIASALASAGQVGGTACLGILGYVGAIYADVTNDRAEFTSLIGADAANRSWEFHFTYRVL